jgi:hypothetical protein
MGGRPQGTPGSVLERSLSAGRNDPSGAPVRVVDGSSDDFIDSVSVRAIKADERSESLDNFSWCNLHVMRNKLLACLRVSS